jgi:hypothetical protein
MDYVLHVMRQNFTFETGSICYVGGPELLSDGQVLWVCGLLCWPCVPTYDRTLQQSFFMRCVNTPADCPAAPSAAAAASHPLAAAVHHSCCCWLHLTVLLAVMHVRGV